ncbi:multiubiquitin domain-containing protein [uncultured Microbacterium sp.]|uniref:multiubiquitin domain-containing protein n=1 Tax=uncultured Microbacterium sp. TaxID=191216 RepID=UPI0025EE8071|nr:multiubiquitin domain-containing protein [uncultured Microbacterium sp.]
MSAHPEAHASKITIHIDGKDYKTVAGPTPVTAVRQLRKPPLPDSAQLWLDIDDAQDQLLETAGTIDLSDGMRFFTDADGITIRIDRAEYVVHQRKMTGLELRNVPTPPVAPDRDLWLDVPDKRDVKIQDDEVVHLKDGMRFFTAPGRINPGMIP